LRGVFLFCARFFADVFVRLTAEGGWLVLIAEGDLFGRDAAKQL